MTLSELTCVLREQEEKLFKMALALADLDRYYTLMHNLRELLRQRPDAEKAKTNGGTHRE